MPPDRRSSKSKAAAVQADTPSKRADHEERRVALRIVVLPRDTNQYGTIFGGVILSYIDQAGFVEARRHGTHRWVTVAMEGVEFRKPVQVGDTVSFYTTTARKGTTSVTVRVHVEAERYQTGETVDVTSATMTLVSVGPDCRPIPFASPPTIRVGVWGGGGGGGGGRNAESPRRVR